MARRKQNNRNKAKPVERADQERVDQEKGEKEPETANPFDFGGLPARDLKKNLGCG